jgi:branched-chain amino acid transport system ATP-binding protein
MPPHAICRLGMTRTFQIVQPFAGQTVRDNIAVGAHLHHRRRAAALRAAEDVAARLGLAAELDQLAANLTIAGRKRLELARALATQPQLLLLDEVLAGLNPQEIADMIPIVRAIRADGVTIVMIEHVMQAVMSLADDVHVLANGRMIASGPPAVIAEDPAVIEAYLGRGTADKLRLAAELAHG